MPGGLSARRDAALALEEQGRYDEAIPEFESIVRDSIVDGPALAALGRIWSARRDIEKANWYFQKALPALGSDTLLINGCILHLVRIGEMERARAIFRSHLRPLRFHHPPGHRAPVWEGQDVRGKVLLLDVGADYFGDAFQFVRFARLAKARGAVVAVQGPERIRPLLERVPGVDLVISRGDSLTPDYAASAFWLLLSLDLPLEELIGDTPYLFAREDLRALWRGGIPPRPRGLNVGIVWQGSNYWCPVNPFGRRTMPLQELRPLARIRGVHLYSLQCGPPRDELYQGRRPFPAVDLTPDFENTAAAILALDAVVTIDTSIAHLSAGLGQTTYIMLPYNPCFRWGMEGENCPWYRSAKLFRQPAPGDWSTVVSAVASRLSSRSAPVMLKRAAAAI